LMFEGIIYFFANHSFSRKRYGYKPWDLDFNSLGSG
jgi:hypothetical protein